MTITNENVTYRSLSGDYTGGPLFSSLDILGGIVGAAMLLLPLTAAGTHYSKVGWDTVQTDSSR